MDPFDALEQARAEFESRLRAVQPGQWDRPTPDEDWTVRDLVGHVVAGNRATVRLLEGCSREDAMVLFADITPGRDPVGEFVAAADAQDGALRAPGALERTVHHPAGDVSGADLLGFRIGDLALHAWDLARAIGADETLDPGLVTVVWENLQPLAPVISQLGMFGAGPSGGLGEDAPLQQRLLDLSGRRP